MDLLQNALAQGLTYGPAVLGVVVAFRILRYPDLTPDGSFIVGTSLYGALVVAGHSPWLATVAAVAGGALCGILTAAFHLVFGVNRLLSGILTSMVAYSLSFRVLEGRSNVSLLGRPGVFESFIGGMPGDATAIALLLVISSALVVLHLLLLKSDLGLELRAVGANESFLAEAGRRPGIFVAFGLALANSSVALSAVLATSAQGFADVNTGLGIIVVLIAALVFGEEVTRRLFRVRLRVLSARVASSLIGAFIYFLCYLLILRASLRDWIPVHIQPTDLRMLSAILITALYAARRRSRSTSEELLPL